MIPYGFQRYLEGVEEDKSETLALGFTGKGARLYNNIRFGPASSGFYASYDLNLKGDLIEFADLQYAESSDFNYK